MVSVSTLTPRSLSQPPGPPLVVAFPRASARSLFGGPHPPAAPPVRVRICRPSVTISPTTVSNAPRLRRAPRETTAPTPLKSLCTLISPPASLLSPLAPWIPHDEVTLPSLIVVRNRRSELRPDRASLEVNSPTRLSFLSLSRFLFSVV